MNAPTGSPVTPSIGEWRIIMTLGPDGHTVALEAYGPDGQCLDRSALPDLYLDYVKVKGAMAAHDLFRAIAAYPDPAEAHLRWSLSPRATRGPCPCPDNRHGLQDAVRR